MAVLPINSFLFVFKPCGAPKMTVFFLKEKKERET